MNLVTANMNALLPNGRQTLTQVQQGIVNCLVEDSSLSAKQLAEIVGCAKDTVYKVLRKQHVREYLIAHVSSELILAGVEAMNVQRKLLHSKSDYIRHESAKDILNRNDIGSSGQVIGQAVQVKIDLS